MPVKTKTIFKLQGTELIGTDKFEFLEEESTMGFIVYKGDIYEVDELIDYSTLDMDLQNAVEPVGTIDVYKELLQMNQACKNMYAMGGGWGGGIYDWDEDTEVDFSTDVEDKSAILIYIEPE